MFMNVLFFLYYRDFFSLSKENVRDNCTLVSNMVCMKIFFRIIAQILCTTRVLNYPFWWEIKGQRWFKGRGQVNYLALQIFFCARASRLSTSVDIETHMTTMSIWPSNSKNFNGQPEKNDWELCSMHIWANQGLTKVWWPELACILLFEISLYTGVPPDQVLFMGWAQQSFSLRWLTYNLFQCSWTWH